MKLSSHHNIDYEAYSLSTSEREFAIRLTNDDRLNWNKREKCPCCDSKNSDVILDYDRFGLSFEILFCENCGFIYFQNVLDDRSVDLYYNEYFLPLTNYSEKTLDKRGVFCQYKFIEPHILSRFRGDEIKILDFGGGDAQMLLIFREYLNRIGILASLDIYEPNKHYWPSYEESGINILTSLKDKNSHDSYNLILLSHVLEHLNKPIGYLKDLKSFLLADGMIYIEVPGIYNTHNFRGFNYHLQSACPHFHSQIFNSKTLINIANRAGLEQIEVTEVVRGLFCKGEERLLLTNNMLHKNAKNIKNYLKIIEVKKEKWGIKNEFFYDVFGRNPYIGKQPNIKQKIFRFIKKVLPEKLLKIIVQLFR